MDSPSPCDAVDGISDYEAVFVESLVMVHLSLPSRIKNHLYIYGPKQISRMLKNELPHCVLRSLFPLIPHLATSVEILWNNFVSVV